MLGIFLLACQPIKTQISGELKNGSLIPVQNSLDVTVTINSSPLSATNITTATFIFSLSNPLATALCNLDGGGDAPCTSPESYVGLAAGNHSLVITPVLTGALTLTPTTYNWTIDVTNPVASITDPVGPLRGGTTEAVNFSGADASMASLKLQYASDGVTFSDVVTLAGSATTYNWSVPSDSVATARLRIIATDTAGNTHSATTSAFVIDSTAPVLTLETLTAVAGGSTEAISLSATDSLSGMDTLDLYYAADGVTFVLLSALATNATNYNWAVPASNIIIPRIRLVGVDLAGNTTTITSSAFTIDSVAPTITAGQMSINGGAGTTVTSYVQVSLQGVDTFTNITKFCLKTSTGAVPAAPTTSDTCWIPVNAPSPGLTPALSLALVNFPYLMGFTPGANTIYAWVMDEATNISTLTSAGSGTAAQDKATITYSPGVPPTLTNVYATLSDAPSNPIIIADATIPLGNDVYIKWNAAATNGMGATPISLYYTTDELTYNLIATNLTNGLNGACTINGGGQPAQTGCYVWSGGSPTSANFKIRVAVLDSNGMITLAPSNNVNVWPPIRLLAGNTDPGTGGSASAAMFFNGDGRDPGSFAISSNGYFYFRDIVRGLLEVNPSTGVQRVLIPTTGVASADGAVASATLRYPFKIAIDYQDRIIIWDWDRIRRYDPVAQTLTTIIGGGALTSDGISPLNVLMTPPAPAGYGASYHAAYAPLIILPNGDIYFRSENLNVGVAIGATTPAGRIRVFHSGTNLVDSIYPSGTGTSGLPAQDISLCSLAQFGISFNPITSVVSRMQMLSNYVSAPPNCNYAALTNLDPTTGVSTAPHPVTVDIYETFIFKVQALTGDLYQMGGYFPRIYKFNSTTGVWDTVVGTGSAGTCADGTAALSCKITPQDAFISAQGQIYFMEFGKLRTIDSSGNVLTLYGQSKAFGDGGAALSARFNSIPHLDMTNANNIIVNDVVEYRLREFSIGGNITTIAGNGQPGTPNTIALANAQAFSTSQTFVVDPITEDVFAQTSGLAKLNRSNGRWETLAGLGGTLYTLADGMTGANVLAGEYGVVPYGINGTDVLGSWMRLNGGSPGDSFLKLHALTDGTQTNLAGVIGPGYLSAFSAPTTATASSVVPTHISIAMARATYDGLNTTPRWLFLIRNTNYITSLTPGGTVETFAVLGATASSFAYKRDALNAPTVSNIYYCNTTDGKIYKKDLVAVTEAALPWPIPSLQCSGYSMIYNSARDSLIFPYTQNGLMGVAEYTNL